MATFRLELRLISPTCIGQRPTAPGQLAASLGYLSGTVLRGALAGLFLSGRRVGELGEQDAATFAQCFQNPEVIFGHATPLADDGQTWVIPQTSWTKKRQPGWKSTDRQASGVRNVLPELLWLEREYDQARADDLDGWDRIGQEFAYLKGGRWADASAQRRLITRSAITPLALSRSADVDTPGSRGVVAAGQLYSLEALEPGQRFAGQISGPDAAIATLRKLVDNRGQSPPSLSVGQGRSRGLGQVSVTAVSDPQLPDRDLAQCVAQAEAFSAAAGADPNTRLLPVTLSADMLLRDRYLLACASGDPGETLRRYRRDAPAGMTLHAAFQSTRWIGGWDELRQLPRRPQLAVAQGSVWVYRVDEGEVKQAIGWWLEVERDGIGERRGEGYGRVGLLHPLTIERELL